MALRSAAKLLGLALAGIALACAGSTFLPGTGGHQSARPKLSHELKTEVGLARRGVGGDRALHAMTAASLAIWDGNAPVAGEMLDIAIEEIEAIYSGDDNAAVEARKRYHKEAEKPFKGEPYERMTAYVYRGLLDYGAGDYQNAAASFRGAILQDAFADEQQNQCDFEVAEYLLARALVAGSSDQHLIDEAFGNARKLARRHNTTLPRLDPGDNVLLYIELGRAPFKVPQGDEKDLLTIGRRSADGLYARVSVDRGPYSATRETGNLAFQAQTRGGRAFDVILAGQAYEKRTTKEGGLTFNHVGTAIGGPVGAGFELAGLIAMAYGHGIKPQADTRYWDKLPDSIHLVPLRLAPGRHEVRVQFGDSEGDIRGEQARVVDVPRRGNVLLWISEADLWPNRPLDRYTGY
ncbi:MAG: hypothetical protein ACE5FL_05545 [Myxococcota bacterium]